MSKFKKNLPLCRIFWPYVVLPFVVLPFVALLTLCRLTQCRLTLCRLTLCRLTLCRSFIHSILNLSFILIAIWDSNGSIKFETILKLILLWQTKLITFWRTLLTLLQRFDKNIHWRSRLSRVLLYIRRRHIYHQSYKIWNIIMNL